MASEAIGTVLEGTKGNVKAARLILVNLSSMDCHSWLKAMREAGQPWHDEPVDNLAKAKMLFEAEPKSHILVCYDNPEDQIANFINNDDAPSQALANWMDQAGSLLEFYRQHYHGITLVEWGSLYSKPKELCKQLASRSGIALDQAKVKQPAKAPEPALEEQQLVVYRLLAKHALEHPPTKQLVQELEASSLPLKNTTDLFDLLDRTYDVFKQAGDSASLKELQQENDLIIEQLHKTQEELEQYLLGNRATHAQARSQEKAERELKKLLNSRSWRMTAPLRNTVQWLRGKKAWRKLAPIRKAIKSSLKRKGRKSS